MQFKIRKMNQQPKRKKDCLACLEVKSENRAEIKRAIKHNSFRNVVNL